MANLTKGGLEALWALAGGDPEDADVAGAIALAESGGDPSKLDNTSAPGKPDYHLPSGNADPEFSIGLWQINWLAHPNFDQDSLYDALYNAQAAVKLRTDDGDFKAWSTFVSGAYKPFLDAPDSTGPTLERQVYEILTSYVQGNLTADQVKAQLGPLEPASGWPAPIDSWIKAFLDATLGGGLFELADLLKVDAPDQPIPDPPESIFKAWDQLMHALAHTVPARQKVMLRAVANVQAAMLRASRL